MNILNFEGITKKYGEKILFDKISGNIEEGDKIGIVGVNGTGKSTLLKIVAGVDEADSGSIKFYKKQSLMYLPQIPEVKAELDIISYILQWHQDQLFALQEYDRLLLNPQKDQAWQNELQRQNDQLEISGAWKLELKAKTILTQLGLKDFNQSMGQLSGGQRKRVALAAALLEGEGLLILDEPTNHLDNEGSFWLEKMLLDSKKTLLMVTHDRYFLDRVATKIWELDQGKLYVYEGNYTTYLSGKENRLALELATEDKRQNLFRNELKWIHKGAQARSTKQRARIQRFEEIKAEQPVKVENSIDIKAASSRLGRKTIIINNISKSYNGEVLFEPFSYTCVAGEKIGIIGANGTGKSTFLRIIAGEIEPDQGDVDRGSTVNIGFFSQQALELDENMRVIDHVKEVAEYIILPNGQQLTALKLCEMFLFSGVAAYTLTNKLSGGEKRRLQLLKVLMKAPNVLLLDEPTNDLDTITLMILEEYLENFQGVVLAVSHDRYFLDKISTSIFSLENIKFTAYKGNYSENQLDEESKTNKSKENSIINNISQPKRTSPTRKKTKLSYKEQIEYDQMEDELTKLEAEIELVNAEIAAAYSDYVKLQALTIKQQELIKTLDNKLERWAELEEIKSEL